MKTDIDDLRPMVYVALMAALTAVGAFVAIPVGPVPVVLQNFFVMLTGLCLGPRRGLAAVGLYLLAGALGLPVFAGGTGGPGRFAGPTGGYLVGYLPAVAIIGIVSQAGRGRIWTDALAMVAGMAIVYGLGLCWLQTLTGMPFSKALAVGLLPFLPADAIKIAAALPVARSLRPLTQKGSA
jgi:biotin transport system substrate-specific component